ncbi:low molecular weight protein-tyrosine-phosphatase [Sandaracinus amylolyticus]|uniref:low molecular weight protein-tyrosine-phosphatase n=1 Tax=Sandaracinus amylolyticus TaxID=927083 RepID=UPI001F181143|nr:low molecular weight protein-tyrosine-phosphatase [Sandaracinus amylolyticus]UJR78763.1 Low molecular weight phosphotyrosine protein phosphatase [Sandaracinus amylolyticus]
MAKSGDVVRVCFVCLGNICRSPTAEAVFRRDVEAAGIAHRFEIDSAGTGDWHVGELAHPRTRATAEQHGIAITHRAQRFTSADFARFDWIVAMDRGNVQALRDLAPDDAEQAKVHLFRTWEADAPLHAEVPDPYYSGQFDLVLEICERASSGLLAHLRTKHGL